MPDQRRHRGPHPDDQRIFDAESLARLRSAVRDLSWLLGQGYAETSALKLVGDRYQLVARQRLAVMRSACSERAARERGARRRTLEDVSGSPILVDGYNLLITVESALAGGWILVGRDGCCRDLASIHGTYRLVEETVPAARCVGELLAESHIASVKWLLDSPVSNSGKLAALLRDVAAECGWPWDVELVPDPDRMLAGSPETVVSSDSWVLDRCSSWVNIAREIVSKRIPGARQLAL